MAVTVYIPAPLRGFTGGRGEVTVDGAPATVGDALALLFAACPGLRDRVLTETGAVRPHVNIFVGGDSIRFGGGLSARVPEGAELTILPAVSGGA